ncbi:MAG TPA: SRPBCC domain-containing protein [Usitatibacter sp.]
MNAIKTYELTLNRTISATPEEVYDAWLDPTLPCNPWHGSKRLDWNVREGGLWYFLHMLDEAKVGNEPKARAHFGRFATLERGRRIQLDWMSYNTRGMESVVTVTLHAKGDETLFSLNHANIPDDDLGRAHEKGWGQLTALLEQRFTK